jgi:gamma-glutamyltranspeptidase/glutathione hydrolase
MTSILGDTSSFAQLATPFGTPSGTENPGGRLNGTTVPGMRPMGWSEQGRSEVVARNGIVTTSHPLAAQAGLEILQKGGNAMDAAVAGLATLNVVSPNDTGIGGDVFVLYWSAADRKLHSLSAAGWSPEGWTSRYFRDRKLEGVNSVTVPGAVAGFDAMLRRFGTMTFKETLERAATIAEQGWGMSERHHRDLVQNLDVVRRDAESARVFLRDGDVPPLYSILRNPDLAETLRLLQERGRDGFYKGPVADAIVARVKAGGGVMSNADLEAFEPEWNEPITTSYRGYDVFQVPPPGQGWATLLQLNLLEACGQKLGLDLSKFNHSSPEYWHLLVETKKLAYSDLLRYNADPKFADVPLDRLLSKEHAAEVCSRIDMKKAGTPDVAGTLKGGTINLIAADRWGNMASVVHSVYNVYGSRITVPGYGFLLHDRGSGFSLDPASPNRVEPRKRPFHTIITGFVTKDGEPLLGFGNMQGSIQAYSLTTHLANMIDLGFSPQATADAARYVHEQKNDGPGRLVLEPRLFERVGEQLQAFGHPVESMKADMSVGGFQGILFQQDKSMPAPPRYPEQAPVNGVYRAGSDPRKDGQAVGW